MYGHYVYTPRELTQWCLSLLRYNMSDLKDSNSLDGLLEIWAYEACRMFQDRLVDDEAKQTFDAILSNVLQDDWRTNIASKIKGLQGINDL
jgi:dynein heavy chain 2